MSEQQFFIRQGEKVQGIEKHRGRFEGAVLGEFGNPQPGAEGPQLVCEPVSDEAKHRRPVECNRFRCA